MNKEAESLAGQIRAWLASGPNIGPNGERFLTEAAARITELEGAALEAADVFKLVTDPDTIRGTSSIQAWSRAVAAEAKLRRALSHGGG